MQLETIDKKGFLTYPIDPEFFKEIEAGGKIEGEINS
jgi:hypothetical protein